MRTVRQLVKLDTGTLVYLALVGIVIVFVAAQPRSAELSGVPLALVTFPSSIAAVAVAEALGEGADDLFGGWGLATISIVLNSALIEWFLRRSQRPKRNVA